MVLKRSEVPIKCNNSEGGSKCAKIALQNEEKIYSYNGIDEKIDDFEIIRDSRFSREERDRLKMVHDAGDRSEVNIA